VIKVIHISENDTVDGVIAKIEEGFNVLQGRDVTYMLDTKKDKSYGGSGKSFNRQIAAGVAGRLPVIIAGGLNPENIASVVEEVHPWGVDVSSGVETNGKKDITKIKEFITEVKAVAGR
jgi:phosphoribosylanthranilate isomerase